jgi:hypothetical protein
MASKGYVQSLLNGLPSEIKVLLQPAFDHVLDTWKLGTATKAANASWYKFSVTTSSVANTEFSFRHGLNQIPTYLVPVVDLASVNSQLVPLTVSRAADDQRVYLKSASTSAVMNIYLEI